MEKIFMSYTKYKIFIQDLIEMYGDGLFIFHLNWKALLRYWWALFFSLSFFYILLFFPVINAMKAKQKIILFFEI